VIATGDERYDPRSERKNPASRNMKILLVDDDPGFCSRTTSDLEQAGIACRAVPETREARQVLTGPDAGTFDVVLLDSDLPEATSWRFLGELRENGHQIPVVFLTAHPSSEDRVQGLNRGADDYMVKTIAQDELVARLHAVLRRTFRSAQVRIQNLIVDPCLRRIECEGKEIDLTPREFDILWALAQASGRAVSAKELLRRLWGIDFDPTTNLVQVHVFHLRKKLESGRPKMIHTVRGEGYRLKV
jgi:DNA-binding response OmpR family regulator